MVEGLRWLISNKPVTYLGISSSYTQMHDNVLHLPKFGQYASLFRFHCIGSLLKTGSKDRPFGIGRISSR